MKATQLLPVLALFVAASKGLEEPSLPDIWLVVEDSYDSNVMVTFPDLKIGASMIVDELYDIEEEQGVLVTTEHGKITKTNYYTKSSQTYVVSGTDCEVGGLVDHKGYHLWGWHYVSDDPNGKKNFLYGPSALLRLVRDYETQMVYKGITELRGIMADKWVVQTRDNYTLDFYFANDEWQMPYGHSLDGIDLKAPLQVKVHGLQDDPWDSSVPSFEQDVVYDFIVFKPFVDVARKRMYLVEGGLNCRNRVTMDPNKLDPPTPPNKFQVFIETVVNVKGSAAQGHPLVFRSWMYYDSNTQLLRLDINPDMDADESVSPYKSIHDYNTGIHYKIDQVTGECEMMALDADEFGNIIGDPALGDIIMADPNQLFHLDEKYIFSGYTETRGIKTSRWSSARDDIRNPETGENFKVAVVDYHFLTEDMTDIGEQKGRPLPVRLDVTIYRDDNESVILSRYTVNLLHMQTSFLSNNFNPFDVRECMDIPSQRTWLKITYSGIWEHGASQKPDEFKKILMEQISGNTDASPVRFPEVQLDHDQEFVFATLLLLEPAPYHLQFKKLADRKPTDDDTQLAAAIADEDLCASDCLRYSKFQCKSFYQCSGLGKNCFVSNYANSGGTDWPVNKPCKHYKRAEIKNTKFQRPNWEIIDWIKTNVAEGNLKIQLTYEDHDGIEHDGMYDPIGTEEELLGDDPILVDLIRADFHVAYKQGYLKAKYTDLKLPKTSYALCVAACEKQMGFRCETLSYCYGAQSCYLSSYVVNTPVGEADVIRKTDCVVVGRSHTDDYEKVDGTVYTGEANLIIQSTDADKCAYHCSNVSSITCRSFDYCQKEHLCYLYEQRTIDMPPEMLNHTVPDCSHYSRDALVDFKKHENQILEGSRDRYLKFVSASYCAQVCEDEPDYGCNGFDYCYEPEDITCFLTSDHYTDEGVEIGNSPSCSHYSREYYDGKDINAYSHSRSSKYIYGPGDMAGLACSMLVIAIAGTFGGVYAYNKYFKK
ncbi:uncharacterized protein LOC122259823 isoform X3 [Penaeus japonicus]|uniref:uncharacterized protein LOC122259823 isoform X3 n=1 Tax=Penaeus japonicus TaxID=27405 RepID=UPI001C7178CE|nr:uncharacterized protein LOC122259823 isoform X3 [Penaeus japonicus]